AGYHDALQAKARGQREGGRRLVVRPGTEPFHQRAQFVFVDLEYIGEFQRLRGDALFVGDAAQVEVEQAQRRGRRETLADRFPRARAALAERAEIGQRGPRRTHAGSRRLRVEPVPGAVGLDVEHRLAIAQAYVHAAGEVGAIALHAVHRHAQPAHLRQDAFAGRAGTDARDEQWRSAQGGQIARDVEG